MISRGIAQPAFLSTSSASDVVTVPFEFVSQTFSEQVVEPTDARSANWASDVVIVDESFVSPQSTI